MFKSKIFHKLFKSDFYLTLDDLRCVAEKVHFNFDDEKLKHCKIQMDALLDLIDILTKVDDKNDSDNENDFNIVNYIHKRMNLRIYRRADDAINTDDINLFDNTEEENNFFVSPKVLDNN